MAAHCLAKHECHSRFIHTLYVLFDMDIVFDLSKNQVNLIKHGVSLLEAESLEWETAVVVEDARHSYGEQRMIGVGYIGNRLYVVVFVDRGSTRRIISLRKANQREVARYAET